MKDILIVGIYQNRDKTVSSFRPDLTQVIRVNSLITLGKGRRVLELCWSEASYTRILRPQWGTFCSHGDPFMGENAHGIPFKEILLSPSHVGGKRKRKLCGTMSEVKVPTCRFSAKKETVWHDLSAIFHNMVK